MQTALPLPCRLTDGERVMMQFLCFASIQDFMFKYFEQYCYYQSTHFYPSRALFIDRQDKLRRAHASLGVLDASSDDIFRAIVSIPKGRKLLARLLVYFSPEQARYVRAILVACSWILDTRCALCCVAQLACTRSYARCTLYVLMFMMVVTMAF